MDDRLRKRLESVSRQLEIMYQAEETFLSLDGAYEHHLACLFRDVDPSITAAAAREKAAKATTQYKEFCEALALAKARFHREKHILDLKMKAYDAEHLTMKVEAPIIKRQL